jgi:hydrogenase nickel incorporation protein HypB
MCGTCGCGQHDKPVRILKPGEEEYSHSYVHAHQHSRGSEVHSHNHDHNYSHSHTDGEVNHEHKHEHNHNDLELNLHHTHGNEHDDESEHDHNHQHQHSHGRQIVIEEDVLHRNDLTAEQNRGYFDAKKLFVVNLVSSPGSGKTSLLEKTIAALKGKAGIYVIEGDQQTMNDANRIKNAGAPVIQINTGNGCHLDADMVNKAAKKLEMAENGILIIENVGNLVCPSLFDLGESRRVVVISVTEGDDKPLKYPTMFETSDICIINKTDLLPYVDFDVAKAREYALQVNPGLAFFELSVKTGEGLEPWIDWVLDGLKGLN